MNMGIRHRISGMYTHNKIHEYCFYNNVLHDPPTARKKKVDNEAAC